jgi:hypothetical protein
MTEQIEAPVSTARHALRPGVPVEPALRPGTAEPALRTGAAEPARRTGTAEPARRTGAAEPAAVRAERERLRRSRAAYEAKLSRLRLYSYCLTLGACVLALMSFMYVTQGTADGDATFTWLGVAFAAATALALWSAVAITRLGDVAI